MPAGEAAEQVGPVALSWEASRKLIAPARPARVGQRDAQRHAESSPASRPRCSAWFCGRPDKSSRNSEFKVAVLRLTRKRANES